MSLRFLPKSHQYRMTEHPGPAHKTENPELRVTGATTILNGGIPKPNLMNWYARTVAEYVRDNPLEVEHLRQLEAETEGAMIRELAKAPERVRDAAAVRGTDVHALAEKILHGLAVDVPADLAPYVDGYLALIDAWDIQPVLTETSIGNRKDWYAGRLDSIATIGALGGEPVLLDWKTSNRVYGETGLQCAAYAKAEFYVTDDAPDTEIPLPQVARTMVCHITPDGSHLYDLARNPAEIDRHYDMFVAAAFTAKTAKERDGIITEPLQLPAELQAAA
ncbi:exonuclease [Arthrobacter phage Jinkies]|uniref:Exonuclease n=1 Tax=Arthrobacter phage Jinkies TaxID=2743903 RepID=A0A7S5WS17_9CAUD|nr:exonuclease [Arthrobacter phage Jinkies]